jgi:hypothetical protein
MAELELIPQKVVTVDSDFAHKEYKKDDGDVTFYEISDTEILYYSLQYNKLLDANFTILYDLWKSKKYYTTFTWLFPKVFGTTEQVAKFVKKPKINLTRNGYTFACDIKWVSAADETPWVDSEAWVDEEAWVD